MFLRISRNSSQLGYSSKNSLKLLGYASKGLVSENNETDLTNLSYQRFNSTNASSNKPRRKSAIPNNQNGDLNKLHNLIDKKPYKQYTDSLGEISPDSPFYHKICAFDDCVSQSLSISKDVPYGRKQSRQNDKQDKLLFWDSVSRAMTLYTELASSTELDAIRTSSLINLLHNALRINRNQLVKLNRKPDNDSKSFNIEITKFITNSLREVSKDIIDGKVKVSEYGVMHLLTSFKELSLFDEAIDVWRQCMKDEELNNFFIHPKTVGVILPILYERNVFTFEECKQLFETSGKRITYQHPNLTCGFINTCLLANENLIALENYSRLCEFCKANQFNYLVDAHLLFIGSSKDVKIAESFFQKAIESDMPYTVHLHVSHVNNFLQNIWTETGDLKKVNEIWGKALTYYRNNAVYKNRNTLGILSSLNNMFFELFFNNYANDTIEGFKALQSCISFYNEVNDKLDEPFLNIILTKCTIWQNKEIIDSILQNFENFNIPQTTITKRIILKSMGSIDNVTNQDILQRWNDLLTKNDEMGQSYIANADWAALRDATIKWSQANIKNPLHKERVDLFLTLVAKYKPYCRDNMQFSRITEGFSRNLPILRDQLAVIDLSSIPTDQIEIVPDLHNLKINEKLL